MMNNHPTDREIQEYALNGSGCSPAAMAHIPSCDVCREAAETYRLLFTAIEQEPQPVFDFDLPDLVLSKLPVQAGTEYPAADRFIAGFLVLFICGCIAVPAFLFRQYIKNLFSGLPDFFIYAIVSSALLILTLRIFSLYKRYRRQLQFLNFH